MVGFLSAYIALQDTSPNLELSHWNEVAISGQDTITCSPKSSISNVTVGQPPQLEANGFIDFIFLLRKNY